MTDPFAALSDRVAALVEAAGPRLVAVHGSDRRPSSSGILWSPELVVTAAGTLEREDDLAVTLADGRRLPAALAGRDAGTGIALLRVQGAGEGLDAPGPGAGKDDVRVGRLLLAVGRAEAGPIAALEIAAMVGGPWHSPRGGRIERHIRLDLALDRAAEGGAVLDGAGRVLGMAVLGARRRGTLVIPSATIARAVAAFEARGRLSRGYLGLAMQPLRMGRGLDAVHGLIVVALDPGGPAERAGVRLGDVIVGWDGVPLTGGGVREVLERLDPDSVGRRVALDLLRGGDPTRVAMTIGERPSA